MKSWPFLLLAPAALTGCSSPPPQTFPPLDYAYLPPIVLKVANLNIVNTYVPGPGAATLIGQDPAPPATVLLDMLNHRLIASGAPGSGTVTIEQASVDQSGGSLVGTMTVDIQLQSADGRATGTTEVSVNASVPAPDPDASQNAVQAALYTLTKNMMEGTSTTPGQPPTNGMNTQLQYQIQHNLGPWVQAAAVPGAAPLAAGAGGGAIQAQPLTPPPSTGAPVPLPGQTINPAVPQYLPGAGPAALPPAAPP